MIAFKGLCISSLGEREEKSSSSMNCSGNTKAIDPAVDKLYTGL